MITKKQYLDALETIERYSSQIAEKHTKSAKEIGCVVTLSVYGKHIDKEIGDKREKTKGKIIDWVKFCHNDGFVTVKWDGIAEPESRHISQVEPI